MPKELLSCLMRRLFWELSGKDAALLQLYGGHYVEVQQSALLVTGVRIFITSLANPCQQMCLRGGFEADLLFGDGC